MQIEKIHHIGIAVEDLNAALDFWRDRLGLRLDHIENVPSHGVRVAFLPAGESEIELVMPINESSAADNKLPGKGQGLDHLCLEVKDLDGALAELKARGVGLINETPTDLPGRRIAFVDPASANGVLLEFYQLTNT